jgi:hypothetical protein
MSRILKHLESCELDIKPNAMCYNNVINCWAKSRQHEAADWAEVIFREMLQGRYIAFLALYGFAVSIGGL